MLSIQTKALLKSNFLIHVRTDATMLYEYHGATTYQTYHAACIPALSELISRKLTERSQQQKKTRSKSLGIHIFQGKPPPPPQLP